MRRAIWMALAFMGTAPLVALAQQGGGGQAPANQSPAASPTGAASIQRGQDTAGAGTAGAPGQQSAGTVGTTQGQPATGGAGTQGPGDQTGLTGVPQQRPTQGNQGLSGTGGTGGAGGTAGPTYRGTTPEIPSATPPLDIGTRVGPEPGGQAAAQRPSAPMSPEAMQRELSDLRQRVSRLEQQLGGQQGTGGAGSEGTAEARAQGPIPVAIVTFDGTVRAVSPTRITLVDRSDGSLYNLVIDKQTKAFVGPGLKRIRPEQISEGTQVRASFSLISGVEHARNIVTQPPRQQPRQRQGAPQGQPQQAPQGQQRVQPR